jgi:MraZ protein
MFIGTYYHTIEEKGRVAVPSKFRENLGSPVIITRGFDGCLFLYARHDWDSMTSSLTSLSVNKKAHRDYVRYLLQGAEEVIPDAQGRILIPDSLKNSANISKQVVFAGSQDKIEVWDMKTYNTYMSDIENRGEEIAEQLDTQTETRT